MVENISDALVEIDPVNAEVYRANARAFIGELEEIYRRMVVRVKLNNLTD